MVNNMDEDLKNNIYENIEKEKNINNETYKYNIVNIIINIVILLTMTIFFIYSFSYNPPEKYVLVDRDNKIIENNNLETFSKSEAEIAQWLTKAIKDSFSYNFTNVDIHPSNVKKYYTENGYKSYSKQFEESSDVVIVKKNKAVSTISRVDPPTILKSGIANGRAAIRFETKIVQVFQGYDGSIREKYKITVVILKQDVKDYEDGIAIESIVRSKDGE